MTFERVDIGPDCTIYRGDCREVLPTLGKVDCVITDPPYEIEAHTLQRRINRGSTRGGSDDVITPEPLDFAPIDESTRMEFAQQAARLSGGWVLVFCQAEAVACWRESLELAGATYKRACVWVKPDGMPQYSGDRPGMGYESIVAAWAGTGKSAWNGGGKHGVFTFNKGDTERWGHPTQKPIRLMCELCKLFCSPRQAILDPFMGSGTTGVAALRHGCKFIGIEIEQKYFDIARRRIEAEVAQRKLFV